MHAANDATTIVMTLADTAAILRAPAAEGLRFGAVGHCMGGRHALAALAAFPDRIMAAASLHGGRLVGEDADSPHLLIPEIRGAAYFAFAADDATCSEPHQATIRATIAASGVNAQTETFDAVHGWTFPERWCHDPAAAERAFMRCAELFDRYVTSRLS